MVPCIIFICFNSIYMKVKNGQKQKWAKTMRPLGQFVKKQATKERTQCMSIYVEFSGRHQVKEPNAASLQEARS